MARGVGRARPSTLGLLAAALALGLAGLPGPAGATAPRLDAGFSPILTYAPPLNLPGPLACVGPSFCMELAFGTDLGSVAPALTGVLTSTDGGTSWTVLPAPRALDAIVAPAYFQTLRFTFQCTSSTVCIAGHDGRLAQTTDGGASWQVLTGGVSPGTKNVVTTCTPGGGCLEEGNTTAAWLAPGASTFVRVAPPPLRGTANALSCPTSSRCVLTLETPDGGGATLTATDPGPHVRWSVLATSLGHELLDVDCTTVLRCVGVELVGGPGPGPVVLARSLDGAVSWTETAAVAATNKPVQAVPTGFSIACSTTVDCVVAAIPYELQGALWVRTYVTTNGGASFDPDDVDGFGHARFADVMGDVACLVEGRCLVDASNLDGPGGFLAASVGPTFARPFLAPPAIDTMATGLACTTGSTCWRVDQFPRADDVAGRLLVSDDDAATWSGVSMPPGVEPVLLGGCQSASTCEVVGVRGAGLIDDELGNADDAGDQVVLASTDDGGSTWSTTTLPEDGEAPLDASCTSSTACVVLVQGVDGAPPVDQLVSTTDGGASWSMYDVQDPNVGVPGGFGDLGFPGVVSCTAAGTCLFASAGIDPAAQVLLRSTDGGATWGAGTSPSGGGVTGIVCLSGTTCDEVTATPTFAQTVDGGATWSTPEELPDATGNPPTLSCSDPSTCTVLAQGELALATTDAGATWTSLAWASPGSDGSDVPGLLTCSATVCLAEDLLVSTPGYLLERSTP